MLDVKINGVAIQMELDIISETAFRNLKCKATIVPTDRRFKCYTGHPVDCVGRVPVEVTVGSTTQRLNLYVVAGETDALFGREWISQFVGQIDLKASVCLAVSPTWTYLSQWWSFHLPFFRAKIPRRVWIRLNASFFETCRIWGGSDC